jgi:hypothetical protein
MTPRTGRSVRWSGSKYQTCGVRWWNTAAVIDRFRDQQPEFGGGRSVFSAGRRSWRHPTPLTCGPEGEAGCPGPESSWSAVEFVGRSSHRSSTPPIYRSLTYLPSFAWSRASLKPERIIPHPGDYRYRSNAGISQTNSAESKPAILAGLRPQDRGTGCQEPDRKGWEGTVSGAPQERRLPCSNCHSTYDWQAGQ